LKQWGKTKVLKGNADNSHHIKLEEQILEEVKAFTYMGSVVDKQGGTDANVRARFGKARAVFVQLKNIWSSKELSLKTKVRLFNTNVKSVVLYGQPRTQAQITKNRHTTVLLHRSVAKLSERGGAWGGRRKRSAWQNM
jgi:hypothetical protein